MKLECRQCAGTGDLVGARDPDTDKKTGERLPATDTNLEAHCRGGGDLGECDVCEGKGYIVTQSEAAKYLMHEVKEGMRLLQDIGMCEPEDLSFKMDQFRIRAMQINSQVLAVTKVIRGEMK